MAARLISIIGPPAVGKTTLAEFLAGALPAEILREDYAGNPFLEESYLGRPEARLPGQLYFLLSRVRQLCVTTWPREGLRVSDYGFCQDRVYASLRLDGDDLRLYEHVAGRVNGLVRPPDLLIHLDADPAALLERIARRGRPHERAMDAAFIEGMRQAYEQVAAKLRQSLPLGLLRVDGGKTDFRQPQAGAELLDRIRARL